MLWLQAVTAQRLVGLLTGIAAALLCFNGGSLPMLWQCVPLLGIYYATKQHLVIAQCVSGAVLHSRLLLLLV